MNPWMISRRAGWSVVFLSAIGALGCGEVWEDAERLLGDDSPSPRTPGSSAQEGEGGAAQAGPAAKEGSPAAGSATPSPTEPDQLSPPWRMGRRYCPMAHCDGQMSDGLGMTVPIGEVGILWQDLTAAGSNYGLGCSSNGSVVACSMGGSGKPGPYLKVYDASGMVLWTSNRLNSSAFYSAPLVDVNGSVIATDSKILIRFNPYGEVVWSTATPGGVPISPVITDSGVVVLASHGGPISIYDRDGGELLDSLLVEDEWQGAKGFYSTRNTPAMRGDRIYVSTEFTTAKGGGSTSPMETRPARLLAVDIDRRAAPGERLKVAWYFQFGARSGSSPLLIDDTIYFDGDRLYAGADEEPHFFAVKDLGDEGELQWVSRLDAQGVASAGRDPRGGFWVFGMDSPFLVRVSEENGRELQRVDVDKLIGMPGVHAPASAMSIGRGLRGQPVLISTAADVESMESWLFALDVETEKLLWKLRYSRKTNGWGAGQYPIAISGDGRPVVVFTTVAKGIIGVGRLPFAPPPAPVGSPPPPPSAQ